MEYILITGGCGYIGSHLALKLFSALDGKVRSELSSELELFSGNRNVLIIDNLSMTGKIPDGLLPFKESIFIRDMNDITSLEEIFKNYKISIVIHMAGFKSVKESVLNPLKYYDNNLTITLNLLKTMEKYNCKNIIFSSSATVYKPVATLTWHPTLAPVNHLSSKLKETNLVGPLTPYGKTKLMIEQVITDIPSLNSIILRYFNPIGCNKTLKESPLSTPENLAPFIIKVLLKEIPELTIFGNDYNTPDGTCIRDFIHIDDLIDGHVAALDYILKGDQVKEVFNLGTGIGYSVLEMIKEFERQGYPIPFKIGPKRNGDIETVCANPEKANKILNWKAKNGLTEMVKNLIETSF